MKTFAACKLADTIATFSHEAVRPKDIPNTTVLSACHQVSTSSAHCELESERCPGPSNIAAYVVALIISSGANPSSEALIKNARL